MRTTVFLFLGLMLFFCSVATFKRRGGSDAKIPIDCSGYPSKICTLEYNPHCGAIRTTYANKCAFCNAYVESDGKLEFEYYGECNRPRKE